MSVMICLHPANGKCLPFWCQDCSTSRLPANWLLRKEPSSSIVLTSCARWRPDQSQIWLKWRRSSGWGSKEEQRLSRRDNRSAMIQPLYLTKLLYGPLGFLSLLRSKSDRHLARRNAFLRFARLVLFVCRSSRSFKTLYQGYSRILCDILRIKHLPGERLCPRARTSRKHTWF